MLHALCFISETLASPFTDSFLRNLLPGSSRFFVRQAVNRLLFSIFRKPHERDLEAEGGRCSLITLSFHF